jgi:hypothetical protein
MHPDLKFARVRPVRAAAQSQPGESAIWPVASGTAPTTRVDARFAMSQRARRHGWRAALLIGAVAATAACTDDSVVGSRPPGENPPPGGGNLSILAVKCSGDTQAGTVKCAAPTGTGASSDLIVGGQHVYVTVATSNVNFNSGTGDFTFDATVRNLIPQPLGTADGSTLDPTGVRVFFVEGLSLPVTSGTGTVTVVPENVGDVATFTASNQPFYQYNEMLSQFELSPVKQWKLSIAGSVTTFEFHLYVSAKVQFPDGWVEIQPAVYNMPALASHALSATVRSALGTVDSMTSVAWVSGNPGVATVDPTSTYVPGSGTYTVNSAGVFAGTTTLTATSGPRTGTMTLNITGIQRRWIGGAAGSETDWHTGANWEHGLVPAPVDSAVFPGDRTFYPVLNQNTTIGGVIMEAQISAAPSIALGAFDLSLGASIDHGPNGVVTGTSGRVIFSGIAQTISGGLSNVDYPAARFFGTYSLNTNLNVTGGRIVVQGGRLRNTGHRIRVRPS